MSLFEPLLSHRFRVRFYFRIIAGFPGIPNPLDAEFQSINGLSQNMEYSTRTEGGRNVGSLHLPTKVSHGNVTLSRGVMLRSPLTMILNQALGSYRLFGMDLTVMALNETGRPTAIWSLMDVMPVTWSTSGLDAKSSQFLINTFTFAYRDMSMQGTYI